MFSGDFFKKFPLPTPSLFHQTVPLPEGLFLPPKLSHFFVSPSLRFFRCPRMTTVFFIAIPVCSAAHSRVPRRPNWPLLLPQVVLGLRGRGEVEEGGHLGPDGGAGGERVGLPEPGGAARRHLRKHQLLSALKKST